MSFRMIALSAIALSSVAFGQKAVNFEQLKVACQKPAEFQNQNAPANLQVTCQDVQYKWQADGSGLAALPNGRQVTSSFSSDKYSVSAKIENVGMQEQAAVCPRFKQVAETVTTTKATNCEEIVAFPGTSTEFCKVVIEDLRTSNPQAINTVETGKTVDFCAAQAGGRGQRPGKGN